MNYKKEENKIVIRIRGGLGNQMFQYAFGKAIALEYNKKLFIDKTILEAYPIPNTVTPRNFELDIFNVEYVEFSSVKKLANKFKHPTIKKILIKGAYYFFNQKYKWQSVVQNNDDHPDDVLNRITKSSNLQLDGYFQSNLFFEKYRDEIIKDFSFKEKPTSNSQEWLDLIKAQKNTVALHVRRGDYLLQHNQSAHGMCDLNYYKKAIEYILSELGSANFMVFSDDIEWCKEQFNSEENKQFFFIEGNTKEHAYEDIRLMTNCQHNIIANSSFSWWAAYLNENDNKIVIRPSKWFALENSSVKEKVICPINWMEI